MDIFFEKLYEIDKNLIIKENESMKAHTSFKVGGCTDVLLIPSTTEKMIEIVNRINDESREYMIIGKGTNIIVSDKGIRGIVIKTTGITDIKKNDTLIIVDAGVNLAKLAHIAYENGLSGLEFASGIPGTLGGAIHMNAGAYDGEMKDIIEYTEYINNRGELTRITNSEHEFKYRESVFQSNDKIILRAGLRLTKGIKEEIKGKMHDFNKKRKEKQPIEMPCAGSVFKRPEGHFAGKLIEDAGLKGFSIGGAMISKKHCGFIVNTGDATSGDILELIEYVQKEVLKKFNVKLEREVKIIGEV